MTNATSAQNLVFTAPLTVVIRPVNGGRVTQTVDADGNITLTAVPADNFVEWQNANGEVLGTGTTLTNANTLAGTTDQDTNPIIAVFKEALPTGEGAVPVYRLFNTTNGEHLLTADKDEADSLVDSGQWILEAYEGNTTGVAFYEYAAETEQSVPVWRLFNLTTGAHLYTKNPVEKNDLVNSGQWVADFGGDAMFYAPTTSNTPVYRLFDITAPDPVADHLWTVDAHEWWSLTHRPTGMAWSDEGVGWYAVPSSMVG